MLPWSPDVTIVQSDVTIVIPWQLSTGSKHDYCFCYCPLVGILFEVLRIECDKNSTLKDQFQMEIYWENFTIYFKNILNEKEISQITNFDIW